MVLKAEFPLVMASSFLNENVKGDDSQKSDISQEWPSLVRASFKWRNEGEGLRKVILEENCSAKIHLGPYQ